VVGVSGDGADALRLARQLTPDLLLLDSSIPGTTSLEMLRQLRADGLGTKAVMLATAINPSEAVSVLRLGARGVLLKGASTELVYKCIRKVHDGELWFSRDIIGVVVESLSAPDAERAPLQNLRLTPREHEVTRHIVGGTPTWRLPGGCRSAKTPSSTTSRTSSTRRASRAAWSWRSSLSTTRW
jgi:DNA-binding NarL/FixJ family response regulator